MSDLPCCQADVAPKNMFSSLATVLIFLNGFLPVIAGQELTPVKIERTFRITGVSWNPSTILNNLVSPTSHGCVRMCNADNVTLHNIMPNPAGNKIIISTLPED